MQGHLASQSGASGWRAAQGWPSGLVERPPPRHITTWPCWRPSIHCAARLCVVMYVVTQYRQCEVIGGTPRPGRHGSIGWMEWACWPANCRYPSIGYFADADCGSTSVTYPVRSDGKVPASSTRFREFEELCRPLIATWVWNPSPAPAGTGQASMFGSQFRELSPRGVSHTLQPSLLASPPCYACRPDEDETV